MREGERKKEELFSEIKFKASFTVSTLYYFYHNYYFRINVIFSSTIESNEILVDEKVVIQGNVK